MEDDSVKLNGDLALISKHRNALMGVAALIICCFHEFLPVFPNGSTLFEIEDFIIRVSFYGVDVFMLLSGMSVAYSLSKKPEVLPFYLRRGKRILPFYLLSGVVMILMGRWNIMDYLLNISGINFFRVDVNSYLWFVTAIILFYLAAPLYQKLMVRTGKTVLTFAVSFVIWYVISIVLRGYIRSDFYYAIDRIPVFMLGMMLGVLIYKGVKIKYPVAFWTGIISLFLIGWLMSYLQNYYSYDYVIGTLLSFLPRIALGVSVPYICGKLIDLINAKWLNKVLEFFGSFCFELYIVQYLIDYKIHYILRDYNIWGIGRNLIMLVSLSLVAFLSSRLVNGCVNKICSLDKNKHNK